jgi:hypothetical protein
MFRGGFFLLAAWIFYAYPAESQIRVEKWDYFELSLDGDVRSNPFTEVNLSVEFTHATGKITVPGFYDGQEVYVVRFMPTEEGPWTYITTSNVKRLNGKKGSFICTPPGRGNRGPVRVRDTFHFAYADGTPYYPVGTTSYAWVHQGDSLERITLRSLRENAFNKIRMCIFPKNYPYNKNEPIYYPFVRDSAGNSDFTRFDIRFWRHFEQRIRELRDLGIEADIILFHPYDWDRWGYDRMPPEADERYLKYALARLAAFRNVWWSMANEFDFMQAKSMDDWDRLFQLVQKEDPGQHLRSIHNGRAIYDHGKPWVTHASIQGHDLRRAAEWRDKYKKPVVYDEVGYEGNLPEDFGDLPAEELVRRMWDGTVNGAYVGHGETFQHPADVLWWSKGGILHGRSPQRIAFLRRIIEEDGIAALQPLDAELCSWRVTRGQVSGIEGEYYLLYLGYRQPGSINFKLPEDRNFRIEIIDTWDMSVVPVLGTFRGAFSLRLPAKPWMAVRIRRVG